MKKRLICMLTLLCVCIASLASAVMVYADGEITIAYNYNVTSCATVESKSEGGVLRVTNLGHGDIIDMYFNADKTAVDFTGKYVHIKGQVSSNLYRIKSRNRTIYEQEK